MEIRQSKTEMILITLLKMALHGRFIDGIDWESLSDNDWKECYRLAVNHGVMAVAYDGVQQLHPDLQPSRPVRLSWAVTVSNYEERYERYCKTAAELSELYSGYGIRMVQLKGVGLSSYYPVPAHREGGDIDIFTYSSDKAVMTDSEANDLADKIMEDMRIDVEKANLKHSNFFFNGISIENHKTFLDIATNPVARQTDMLLNELLRPQETELCGGKYMIYTPSPEFNALFLSFHAGQHYCSGFKLHHLFDYACMLKKYGLQLSDKITDKKLLRFIHALTSLCNRLFDTDIIIPENEKMTIEVYEQLMHPLFDGSGPKNKIGIFIYKIARLFHTNYKQSKIFSKPLHKVVWHSLIFHIKNPKTVFTV